MSYIFRILSTPFSSCLVVLKNCNYKIIDPYPLKAMTSFMNNSCHYCSLLSFIYITKIFKFHYFFRLDFTNFVTSVTSVTGVCVDSFIATTPSGVTTTAICGTNTGLHSNDLFQTILARTKTKKYLLFYYKMIDSLSL